MRQNWLEWVVLAISAIAVVGLIGFLVVDGVTDEARPPRPMVQLREADAYQAPSGWIVPADVTNDGDDAAAAVVLRATATVAGATEESEVTIDFLPAGTGVEIAFGFSERPEGTVVVSTVGFRLP